MLNFIKNETDLSGSLDKIKVLSTKIEQKITQKSNENDSFIETLSVEELKDVRQVILAAEYLLTKYQYKHDVKKFLQEFVEIVLNAANSVNGLNPELEDLTISAEFVLSQIQTLHQDITKNLAFGRVTQTKIDDFKIPPLISSIETEEKIPAREISSINLTNSIRRVNTSDYLQRTPVEI